MFPCEIRKTCAFSIVYEKELSELFLRNQKTLQFLTKTPNEHTQKMLCLQKSHILILILIESTIIFGAPQTDGYTHPTDDDDRVISHVIDPTSNGTEIFSRTMDSANNNDQVVSIVVDMNSSDTSKLFNQFNISVADVMRRINKQEPDNSHRNSEETDSQGNDDDDHDGNKDERG